MPRSSYVAKIYTETLSQFYLLSNCTTNGCQLLDSVTISAITPDTYTGDVHSYCQWNASAQEVNNIQFYNNDVYYLVNFTPTPGIYRKNNNWGGPIDLGFN